MSQFTGTTAADRRDARAAAAAPDASGVFTHRQILTILSGLMAGMFLAALDQTIVSTSIRTIADDLQGSAAGLGDDGVPDHRDDHHPALRQAVRHLRPAAAVPRRDPIFVLGSVLCGFATSMYELAAFRAIQGLGAGGLISLALAIIADIVPPRERAEVPGLLPGRLRHVERDRPGLGGFLAGQDTILGVDGWRWVFLDQRADRHPRAHRRQPVLHLPHVAPRPPHRLAGRARPGASAWCRC